MTPEQSKMLTYAIHLASQIHMEQRDKAGEPYIFHCLAVMGTCKTFEEKVAGVLHDVLEDGEMETTDLHRLGFPADIVEIVQIVSRRQGETYESFIDRIANSGNVHAMWVKLADLAHNMDITRLSDQFDKKLQDEYYKRMKRYRPAYDKLVEAAARESRLEKRG